MDHSSDRRHVFCFYADRNVLFRAGKLVLLYSWEKSDSDRIAYMGRILFSVCIVISLLYAYGEKHPFLHSRNIKKFPEFIKTLPSGSIFADFGRMASLYPDLLARKCSL